MLALPPPCAAAVPAATNRRKPAVQWSAPRSAAATSAPGDWARMEPPVMCAISWNSETYTVSLRAHAGQRCAQSSSRRPHRARWCSGRVASSAGGRNQIRVPSVLAFSPAATDTSGRPVSARAKAVSPGRSRENSRTAATARSAWVVALTAASSRSPGRGCTPT